VSPSRHTGPHPAENLKEWLKRAGYEQSRTVEKLMEHVFLAEVLQECWFHRRQIVEVLRAEVDAAGYDLVLEAGGKIRHVQLKASRQDGKTSKQTVNAKLADRQGGCVIWIAYDVDESTGRAKLIYRWWDSKKQKLPPRVGINPHTGKERPNTVVLKKSDFELVLDTPALIHRLFGRTPSRST
jgi:hypothetical protein